MQPIPLPGAYGYRECDRSTDKGFADLENPTARMDVTIAGIRRSTMTVAFRRVERPLVVGLALFLVGAGAGDTPWEDLDERGWKARERGDYAAAEVHFRAAMEVAKAFGERDQRLGH